MEHLDSAENMEKVTALAGELKIAGYENARPERSISFMPGEMSRKRGES